jgi:Outer membrane protein beta-barrel domain
MKKLLFLAIAFSLKFAAIAQTKIPILIRADFGSSNIKTNTGKGKSTFALGLGVETFLNIKNVSRDGKLVINPNLSYLNTGYETIVGGKVSVNYLSLGLPICYEIFGLNSNNDNGLIFGAGPFINVALSGKFKNLAINDFKNMSFGNSTADNRKSTDVGLLLKTAIRVKKLYMGLQYNVGLANEVPNDRISNGSYINTRNFLFYASYAIWK